MKYSLETERMIRVSSENIHSMAYYPLSMRLFVRFMKEEILYIYENVPEREWYGLRAALYLDQYFNFHIAGKYPVSKRNIKY